MSISVRTHTHAKTLRRAVFLTKSKKPAYTLCYACIGSKETSAGSKAVTRTTLARLKVEEKQHKHFYFAKGNANCTNPSHDSSVHTGAPSQAAPPLIDAVENQECFLHGDLLPRRLFSLTVFSRGKALHSQEDPQLETLKQSREASCHQSKT